MRLITFFLWHTSLLLSLTLIPQFVLINKGAISLTARQSLGLFCLEILVITALEILIISLANLINGRIKKIILSIWAAALVPITFVSLLDYKIIDDLGGQLPSSISNFIINNPSIVISAVFSNITVSLVLVLLVSIFISIFLIISMLRAEKEQRRIVLGSILVIMTVVFLAYSNATSCQITSASYELENQIQKLRIASLLGITSNLFCQVTYAQPNENNMQPSDFNDRQINKLLKIQSEPLLALAPNKGKKKNIVIVVMESVERDKTTAYNPDIPTTPFLAKIAQEGIRVDNAYADFAWTTKSLVSIHCGNPPYTSMRMVASSVNGIKKPCLSTLLKPLGYNSAFFQAPIEKFERRNTVADNLGFDKFSSADDLDWSVWNKVENVGIEERAMLKPIMQWVDQQEEPFLLSVLTLSGHSYVAGPNPSFPQMHLSDNERENNYLNAVRYVDLFLFELFSEFQQRDLLDDTLFVFTSDTGQQAFMKHSSEPTDKHLKIPLLFWSNSLIKKPQTVSGIWQHTDILPTIIDLLDFKITKGLTYGSSVLKKPFPNKNIHLVCKNNACLVRLDEKQKFVYRYNDQTAGLYDDSDPDLKNNIISTLSTQKIHEYIAELKTWSITAAALY